MSGANSSPETRSPQEQANRLRIFEEELSAAEQAGGVSLTSEQFVQLRAYLDGRLEELTAAYDIDISSSESKLSLGLKIASGLGGIALCAAVVLFLQRFLGLWPTTVQVIVLAALPIGLTLAAEWAARRERTLYFTSLISLVAFAAFVTNLMVLGGIFNVASTPNALLVWGYFGLVLAYHFGLRLMLAAGVASLLAWVIAQPEYWRGRWWLDFDSKPEHLMLAGAVCFALPFAWKFARRPDFAAVYRLLSLLAVFLPMLYLAGTGDSDFLSWTDDTVGFFYQTVGMLVAVGLIWLGVRRSWDGVTNTATLFFLLFLLFRLVDWWWDWMPAYLFFTLIGAIAIGLVAIFKQLRSRMRAHPVLASGNGGEVAG